MSKYHLLFAAAGFSVASFVSGCGDGEEAGGGGSGGVGGPDAGGTGGLGATGGVGGTGGIPGCYTATFASPTNGAHLTAAEDLDGDCSTGVDIDVTVATNAPDGTSATLLADGQQVGSASALGSVVVFKGVTLQSTGSTKLTVRIGTDPTCDESIDLTQSCGAECEITKPVLSATHPKLNGVPVADGGDRVSAPGQDYQVGFEVKTSIEDGQAVSLTVDGKAQVAVAIASGGLAKFPGVTLVPDGDHKVQGKCQPKAGQAGGSAEITYPVDTTPPTLENTSPADGKFFGPGDDSNNTKAGLQFKVCGETPSADAIDLPASLGAGQENFCAGVGSSTPTCVAATKAGANGNDGGCVELDCPGGAPFDLTVILTDEAGNPTKKTILGVRCASTLPSVQIVEPVDGIGSDVSKHILAANASQTRKDQDGNVPGAQYTVVACTDAAGGKGTLRSGSTTLVAGITAVPAVPADSCPVGLNQVLKFAATLPESAEDSGGNLVAGTALEVDVEEVSTAVGTSPIVKVWVDSQAPAITENFPNPLCGKLYQSSTSVQATLQLVSSAVPVTLTVTNGTGTQNYQGGAVPGIISLGPVTFQQGSNAVAATATEPSGNTGALKSPCAVSVGDPPLVTWVAPTAASAMNASTDGNAGTAGWQGTLTVQTDIGGSGATVTFELDCGGTVTNIGTANVNGAGVATLANATVPECPAGGKLTAKTSSLPSKGVGTATLTKVVDTIVPGAPTALAASVKIRRATTFGLSWTAPADGGQAVGGYQVRVSKQPITGANFDSAEAVAFTGAPKAPGQPETIDVADRLIEADYYFAVAATDAGGNRSGIVATGPTKASLNATTLSGGSGDAFGFSIDGSTSVNGDALADLIVGTQGGNAVRVYYGKSGGFTNTADITITGTPGTYFGYALAMVGDIDADGRSDLAIGSVLEASTGRVYIFKGRVTWPSTLGVADADYVISADGSGAGDPNFNNALFGSMIRPLGDFDGDGAADFAVGAQGYNGGQGHVTIIRGTASGTPFPATVVVPQALGTRATAIPGPSGIALFGAAGTGLAGFYSGGLPSLVVGASYQGKVYAFKGGSALPATIALSSGEAYTGSAALWTGTVVNALGAIGGVPALGVGSPAYSGVAGGDARLFVGNPASGVFAGTSSTFTNSEATAVGDQFGAAVFGGGFSGSTVHVSLINGPQSDVAFSSAKLGANPAKVYIVDGAKVGASGDVATAADVTYTLPANWQGSAWLSGPVRDADGDGFAELAIGEQSSNFPYDGRVIVLW